MKRRIAPFVSLVVFLAGWYALAYSLGFVVATGLLHLAGIGLGAATRWPNGLIAVRTAGAGIAVAGLVFLRAAL